MAKPTELVPVTLDRLMLKTLALETMRDWGIAQRIRHVSREVLRVNQGALYPALDRLEQQGWIGAKWGDQKTSERQVLFTYPGRSQVPAPGARPMEAAFFGH